MRARKIVGLFAIAVVLGIASWYAVEPSPEMSSLASAWFFWLPGWAHYWLWPESAIGLMAMTIAVYTAQYFAVFLFLAAGAPLARDFLQPHKHRVGLLGRRS
jgi:hypothetical protein